MSHRFALMSVMSSDNFARNFSFRRVKLIRRNFSNLGKLQTMRHYSVIVTFFSNCQKKNKKEVKYIYFGLNLNSDTDSHRCKIQTGGSETCAIFDSNSLT